MTQSDKQKLSSFLNTAEQFAHFLESHRGQLLTLLSTYETHDAATDEIERSISTLLGAHAELEDIKKPHTTLVMSTFFPLNLPLYSLVLFGIMPSAFAANIYIRPPEVMYDILSKLWTLLKIDSFFPELSLHQVPRQAFMSLYAIESDVIIFTGKSKNAIDIHASCPDSLLVYNGSGVNPLIIFDNADVELAVNKSIEMRCFNSGQDCAGPDAFFVHSSISDEYVHELTQKLKDVKVGDTQDSTVRVGPTIKQTYIKELVDWIEDSGVEIVSGGQIDTNKHLVYPTVARTSLSDHPRLDFHEFFAPFFYVVEYKDDSELEAAIHNQLFKQRAMYVSVFGTNAKIENQLDFVTLLHNQIVNDVERGNTEYGGYGPEANYLLYGDQKIVTPILISRDIHKLLPND